MTNSVTSEKKENVVAGIVGAFLFSLAGAAVWILLYMVGFFAGISGLIGAVCAIQGYKLFGGVLSKKGVIIATVIALLVLVLAWYCCVAKDLYDATKEWFEAGDIDTMPSYFDCLRNVDLVFSEPELASEYIKDLAIGLVLAVIGAFSYIVQSFKKAGDTSGNTAPQYNSQPPVSIVRTDDTPEVPVQEIQPDVSNSEPESEIQPDVTENTVNAGDGENNE